VRSKTAPGARIAIATDIHAMRTADGRCILVSVAVQDRFKVQCKGLVAFSDLFCLFDVVGIVRR